MFNMLFGRQNKTFVDPLESNEHAEYRGIRYKLDKEGQINQKSVDSILYFLISDIQRRFGKDKVDKFLRQFMQSNSSQKVIE